MNSAMRNTREDLFAVAEKFSLQDKIIDVRPFGNGNINATYLVTRDTDRKDCFVLQRINTQVFRRPELVMRNMRIATEHVRQSLKYRTHVSGRCWKVPQVLSACDGRDHWIEPDGSFWRAISFVDDTRSFETVQDDRHAGEVGHALGMFHALLSDLPPDRLADTLEGFHITPPLPPAL